MYSYISIYNIFPDDDDADNLLIIVIVVCILVVIICCCCCMDILFCYFCKRKGRYYQSEGTH